MAGGLAADFGRGGVDAMTKEQWAAWAVINAALLLAVLALWWRVTR